MPAALTGEKLKKMTIKQQKNFLESRGLKNKGLKHKLQCLDLEIAGFKQKNFDRVSLL